MRNAMMRICWTALGVLAAALLVTSPVTHAQIFPNDPLPLDLVKASQEFDQAQVAGDRAVLERILGDELFLIAGSGKIESKADFIRDFTAPGFKLEPFTIMEPVHKVRGNIAILGGVVNFKGMQDGKPFNQRIRFSDIWEKRADGRWQVVYIQVTRVLPQ